MELQNVLADVRRGLWVPPKKKRRGARERAESGEAQPFGPFAVELTKSRAGQVAEKTTKHESWALGHLVPFFGDWALSEIDVEGVDEYRAFKVEESEARARAIERGKPKRNEHGQILRPLSARSINRTIDHLQWVLSIALEYKRFGVAENAAEGKRRRLRGAAPPPPTSTAPPRSRRCLRRRPSSTAILATNCAEREAIVGTFVLGGPRAIELGHMLWRDIDLAGSRIFIGCSKTAAGLREIEILPILRDILAVHRAIAYRGDPDALVFPTLTGGRRDADSLRTRVLAAVFERADELLEQRGLVPLPKGLTTHKLRHAFASILVALGEDPISVMRQIGHADPNFTLRVYTHMMIRDPAERQRLKALVRGERVIARSAPPPNRSTSWPTSCRSWGPSPSAAVGRAAARCSRRSGRRWSIVTRGGTSKRCRRRAALAAAARQGPRAAWSGAAGWR